MSFQWSGSVMENHKLADYEGNDWLFQMYSGDTEQHYSTPTRNALAESEVIKICDGRGRHLKHNKGKWPALSCDFPEFEGPRSAPCSEPVHEAPGEGSPEEGSPGEGSPVNLGLAIGLPIGIFAPILLVVLGWYFAPKLRRRFRGEGAIQL
jgi:hypothetical protein